MIRHTDESLRSAALLRFREASQRLGASRMKRMALLWGVMIVTALVVAVTTSAMLR